MKDDASHILENNASYAGRWVARLHGKIIAQGGTPEQALRASQQTRHKEKPEITYMSIPFPLPALIDKVKKILGNEEIYLVGGSVRDILIGRLSSDLDFALPTNGISTARKVANVLDAYFLRLDDERDTGRVIVADGDARIFLDFAAYRGANLEGDLRGRDFTINALAYDVRSDAILDPLNGAVDLHAKLIKACSSSSFFDDPVRILRAVRQAAAFGFHIDIETREMMKKTADQLGRVSSERLRDELFKMLDGPKPSDSMRALEMLNVFPHFLPELTSLKGVEQPSPHSHDVWTHTLYVIASMDRLIDLSYLDEFKTEDQFENQFKEYFGQYRERFRSHFAESLNPDRSLRSLLILAALYHDISKPQTQTRDEEGRIHFYEHEVVGADVAADRARVLNLSNDEIERLHKIVRNHMRIHSLANRLHEEGQLPTRRAIYRFFRDSEISGVDLVLLALADLRGIYGDTLPQDLWKTYLDIAKLLLENYWDRPQEVISPPRLLDGNELMKELNLEPGPVVGQLLEAIREQQAEGKIQNREQALALAREEFTKGMTNKS